MERTLQLALFGTSALLLSLSLGTGSAIAASPVAAATKKEAPKDPKKEPVKKEPAKEQPPPEAPKEVVKPAPKPGDDDPLSDESITGPAQGNTAAGGPAVQKTGPTVLMLPLMPIYRSVTQAKIQMANDLLAKEMNHKDTFQVIRGGVAKSDVAGPSIDAAAKAVELAKKAEADHDAAKAIEHRKKVVEELEKNAAAVDPDDFVSAHHYLARAFMWAGQDKEAQDTIDIAARMRPAFALEANEFSRLYRKWAAKAAEKAIADKPGDLMVKSGLPGAQITLDGRAMDVAPVLLKKVVPGRHLLGARIEGVPPFAAVIEVKPGNKNEYTVAFSNTMGGSSVGAVADAISQNSIPKKAVESAAQAGKDAGAAFVVAGGLAKDEEHFHVHTFVIDVAKGQIAPLEVVDFDLELLTAETDVLHIVQNVSALVSSFSGGESAVAMIDKRIRSQNTINEVAAAPSMTADDGKRDPKDAAAKAKKRDVYKPLKGTNVQIKDEED